LKHNFRFTILLLLIATVLLYSASHVPSGSAQSTSETTVETFTFHYYSLMQKAENGSYFVYDGADVVGPRLTTAFQTTLNSQMMGTRSGFTYWSAAILWGMELQNDVHVLGNVEIRAYISSTFTDFLLGGGYGMGLADIDENENIIEEFITEGPQSLMTNPFTDTPKLYTLSVFVDHVFKKGHYLGFFVGAGATTQGYTFTVYFDSPDRNSGASLPIVESTTPPPIDITPPTITHTPISAANDGQTITIPATITDNVAVNEAKLYHRKVGETTYTSITMVLSGNTYTGTIPASIVTTAGVQYYINATDGTNVSTHPATNPTTSPHTITVILINIPPTAATLNKPSNITQNSMKLVWTQNTEADFAGYEIYQSTTSGTVGTKIYTIADRLITSYTVTELSADTTYYFTVRVVDTAGLFADSVQEIGRTTESSQADGTETIPPWIWWLVGGLVTISAVLTITMLALRRRKK
jgi:hypothetical protein